MTGCLVFQDQEMCSCLNYPVLSSERPVICMFIQMLYVYTDASDIHMILVRNWWSCCQQMSIHHLQKNSNMEIG